MSDFKPIEIIIKNSGDATTSPNPVSPNTAATTPGQTEPSGKKKDKNLTQSTLETALIGQARNWVSYGISQYQNLTGNHTISRDLALASQLIGYGTMIAMNPVVGSIAVASQLAMQGINTYIEFQKFEYQVDKTRFRAGAIYVNGGRGTNE